MGTLSVVAKKKDDCIDLIIGKTLISVNIPNGVTVLEYDAFGKCNCLESVTIPNGVTSIGGGAFSECTKLIYMNSSSEL